MYIPKYIIYFLFFCIVTISCNINSKNTPPIDPNTMQQILMDMHVAEYYSQGLGAQQGTFVKNMDSLTVFYAAIFKKYEIDLEKLKEIMDWYQQNPILFDTIYLRSISHLDSIKQSINNPAIKATDTTKTDSTQANN